MFKWQSSASIFKEKLRIWPHVLTLHKNKCECVCSGGWPFRVSAPSALFNLHILQMMCKCDSALWARLSLIGIWTGKEMRLMAWKELNPPKTNKAVFFPTMLRSASIVQAGAGEVAKCKPQLNWASLAPLLFTVPKRGPGSIPAAEEINPVCLNEPTSLQHVCT